jgi:RNA polymerase sigma factor (sigma-70 family)
MGPAEEKRDSYLGDISTLWGLLQDAHGALPEEAYQSMCRLLQRYYGAARRYLQGALHDPEAAEELAQEFALRFLRGDFQGADPARGRFRDYLKTVLFRMVANHRKQRQQQPTQLAGLEAVAAAPEADPERGFLDSWRENLLERAREALARVERQTGQPYYKVLHLRLEHPAEELPSAQLAERLGAQLDKVISADHARKLLQRAREKFAECMVDDVAGSLPDPTPQQLEQELEELGLLAYCRPALEKRAQRD